MIPDTARRRPAGRRVGLSYLYGNAEGVAREAIREFELGEMTSSRTTKIQTKHRA
jgi:hypothetical protein